MIRWKIACAMPIVCLCVAWSQPADPPLLTWDELIQLYQQENLPAELRDKLGHLLTTPFVHNGPADQGRAPLKPQQPQMGRFLRVAEWNIERGLEFDAVRLAFTDARKFNALMEDKQSKASDEDREHIREQIGILKDADVLVLNEVDWGMNRTLFRNVAAELADALGMNYAYGVEFVEVDPITMGIDQQVVVREVEETYADPHDDKEAMLQHVREVMKPDPQRYHGMHGTAILSRYRLDNVRLIPCPDVARDSSQQDPVRVVQLSLVAQTREDGWHCGIGTRIEVDLGIELRQERPGCFRRSTARCEHGPKQQSCLGADSVRNHCA
jgi:hypothetical protein